MALLTVLLTLGLVQFKSADTYLYPRNWFQRWKQIVTTRLGTRTAFTLAVIVLIPTLVVAVLLFIVDSTLGAFILLLINTAALFYCCGHGNYQQTLAEYRRAWQQGDLHAAQMAAAPLLGYASEPMHRIAVPNESVIDPQTLHQQVFRATADRAFERLFAVLFWFLLLGVFGALVYHLSQRYTKEQARATTPDELVAERWLWLLEWLPARVMGFSFAIVGNFSGCYQAWHEYLTCRKRSTSDILQIYIVGALGGSNNKITEVAEEEVLQSCGAELGALQALLSRVLFLWVTLLALISLFGR
ncbi:MAG: regulatory signaling modulator protein AmpE [Gammaproteobacteria bacterium]|nr:regulatory signaling modulator protein AmpE [Gammaproteobacteria bacterium]